MTLTRTRLLLMVVASLVSAVPSLASIRQIPIQAQIDNSVGRYKINALLLMDSANDRATPLMVYTHGAGNPPEMRKRITVDSMVPKVQEFLRMGFNVLVVERRGYGRSTEPYVEIPGDPEVCDTRDYMAMGTNMTSDFMGALDYTIRKGLVNPESIVLSGKSRGGFASIFMSAYRYPRVKAVLNFSGGAGGKGPNNCNKPGMSMTLKKAGETSRVPTFWIYAANDSYFYPEYAKSMYQDFRSTGGVGVYIPMPAFGDDGHYLFEDGVSLWSPHARNFLKRVGVCPKCR